MRYSKFEWIRLNPFKVLTGKSDKLSFQNVDSIRTKYKNKP